MRRSVKPNPTAVAHYIEGLKGKNYYSFTFNP